MRSPLAVVVVRIKLLELWVVKAGFRTSGVSGENCDALAVWRREWKRVSPAAAATPVTAAIPTNLRLETRFVVVVVLIYSLFCLF